MDSRPIVKFDVETRSSYSLPDVGRYKYLSSPDAALLMFSYKVGQASTEWWAPDMAVPTFFRSPADYRFAGFNVNFDRLAMNRFRRHFGFGFIELEQCIDVMAVAARYGYPQSLDKLGAVLGISLPKMSEGTRLKKLFCYPPFATPQTHPEEFRLFKAYNIRDVDAMSQIMDRLPTPGLSENEQNIWVEISYMNARGLPIDVKSVKQINKIVKYYTEKQTKRIPFITGGAVTTIHQRQRIIDWAKSKSVSLPNLQKLTVDDTVQSLQQKIADESYVRVVGAERVKELREVLDLLKIRQLIGGAAVKKFDRLENMTLNERINDNARYHGAGTGRTTGGGFQMLNLPRAKVKFDKEKTTYDEAVVGLLVKFFDTSILHHENPMEEAKKLVRPMIRAPKGKVLLVADWSSIEYILLMYYAGEWEKVRKFRNGNDPYIDFATELFHVDYDDVTSQQRQESKPPVLGSGYMLGSGVPRSCPPGGLIGYALGYGVEMTDAQAVFATNTYRNSHPRVVKAWYALKSAALQAVKNPDHKMNVYTYDEDNTPFSLNTSFMCTKDRTGVSWLIMTIPSGRNLYYCSPVITDSRFGPAIKHKGINPQTKQWGWVWFKPQRTIENVIQALGRDILQAATAKLRQLNFNLIFTVYDEIGCEESENGARHRLREMERVMAEPPPWMPDLPLRSEGYISKRYMKG
jgi:DNA polymerase